MTNQAPKKDKKKGGGLVSGLILLGVGVIFFLDSFFIIDISDSWPMILVVVGVALIAGSIQRQQSGGSSTQ